MQLIPVGYSVHCSYSGFALLRMHCIACPPASYACMHTVKTFKYVFKTLSSIRRNDFCLFIVCCLINVLSAASVLCAHNIAWVTIDIGVAKMLWWICIFVILKPNYWITVCAFPFACFFPTVFCAWISIAHTSYTWSVVGFVSPTLSIQRLWSFLFNLIFHLNEFIIVSLITSESFVTRSNSIKLNWIKNVY